MINTNSYVFNFILLALASLTSSFGCSGEVHEAEAAAHFEVTHPLRETRDVTHEYVAQIRAIRHIELRALEGGYLRDFFVDEGERVEAGQPLFQITQSVYQAEAARSSAEAQFAELEFQNTQTLQRGNVVSENELAMARANLSRAQAQRNLARAHLGFTRIDAPFDGIMGRLQVRQGSLLEEGELLSELSDISEMWVYFNLSETEYLAYQNRRRGTRDGGPDQEDPAEDDSSPGSPPRAEQVRLRMANGDVFEEVGVIQTIEADFNNETGTIAFRAGFPNPERLLRHGQTGKVIMTSTLENALFIPQNAVFDILDRKFVFVVDDEGIVHTREISVGATLEHLYVVGSGLDEDDRVLIEGLRRVHDGQHLEPIERDAREVFSELALPAE